MAYVYTAAQYVLLFLVPGGKFRLVSNFMELHALTLGTHFSLATEYRSHKTL